MTTARDQRSALVFGASGFLGRWLVKELLDQDVHTTAAIRSDASARGLISWLEDHGVATFGLQLLPVDLTVDGLGIARARCPRSARSTTSLARTPSG